MNIYDDYAKKDIDIKNLRVRIKKLEEENKTLKDNIEFLHQCLDDRDKSIEIMKEENEKLKADYIKLSKIVEVSGGYKASYVNELRDKIAKLEFDIEARIKLKAVREEKERMLNEKIGKFIMNK